MWRNRRAKISTELRSRFEFYGEDILADAVAAGEYSSKGPQLNKLLQDNRQEAVEWLQEEREARKWGDRLTFSILIFTFLAALAAAIEPFVIHP